MIRFEKWHGAGNDFVVIWDGDGSVQRSQLASSDRVARLCDRHFGVGADGLILVQRVNDTPTLAFRMRYFNADGCESTFCGNGARCAVKFALLCGQTLDGVTTSGSTASLRFLAANGEHDALYDAQLDLVSISFGSLDLHRSCGLVEPAVVDALRSDAPVGTDCFVNTGSPHHVRFCDASLPEQGEARALGRRIRSLYAAGANVNFVVIDHDDAAAAAAERSTTTTLRVRTYERGVEDLTLACGTGVVASALAAGVRLARRGQQTARIVVDGGATLLVRFALSDGADDKADIVARDVWLCGPAERVFRGEWSA